MTSPNDPRGRRPENLEGDRDLDARLVAYLGDAPTRAPEHLLDAAAIRVHQTPQRRRPWSLGGWMTSWAVVAAVIAVVVVASIRFGIGPDPEVGASPSPSLSVVTLGPGRQAEIVQQTAMPTVVRSVVVVDGRPWAVLVDGLVFQIDPATGDVLTELDAELDEATGVAVGGDAVWIGSTDGDLVKVDAVTATIETEIAVGIAHHAVAANDTAVWVAGQTDARRIDVSTLAVTPFELPPGVLELATVGDEVWATYASGAIVVADGVTGAVRATLQPALGDDLEAAGIIATARDDVWVTGGAGSMHRIASRSAAILDTIGFEPAGIVTALAPDATGVWVLFGDSGKLVRLDRGTLQMSNLIDVGIGARGIGVVPAGLALWGAGGIRVLAIEGGG